MDKIFCAALLLAIFIIPASAASWSGGVSTNTTSWYIYRNGATVGLDLSGSAFGQISPIEGPGGRILGAYHSYYAEIDTNDVRLRERTGALEGEYSAEEIVRLRSEAENSVNMTIAKPAGSNVWTTTWYETWPVTLDSRRTIEYSGKEINNRDFVGNNLDYAGMNFLYNQEFSKERTTNLRLERMNATVVATNDSIISADFMPTKYLGYLVVAHSTGIADLKYLQKGSRFDYKRSDYVTVSEGMERYYGTYNITQKIEMKSEYVDSNTTADMSWLGCCFGGYLDMNAKDTKWIEPGVFDCTCFNVPEVAEF